MNLPPRVPLAHLPTPLVEVPRLAQALGGPRLFMKRDDLTGFGFGGNKIRGLEFYLADALAQQADVVVTGAGPQSNHIRATAAAARRAGMDVVAIIHDSRPTETQGNLLLDELLGVETRFTDSPDRAAVDDMIEAVAAELRGAGRKPYVVPRGGASALGSLGYMLCVEEMNAQFSTMGIEPSLLVLATGSCGTQAGLLAGMSVYGAPYRMVGVTVSRSVEECVERVGRIAAETAKLAGHEFRLAPGAVVVLGDYIGPGYGIPTPECVEAIRLVARTEGIFFDPTYTGKGMAGLIGEVRAGRIGRDETVVFLHTGGEPGLFAHAEELGEENS
jgi:D-cysteine desulfhydrase